MSVASLPGYAIVYPRASFVEALPSSYGKSMAADPLRMAMEYLNMAEIGHSVRVCKTWNKAIDGKAQSQVVWEKLSERMGIPLVESQEGHLRDRKLDLKAMYPITMSGLQIAETLGKPVGKTPSIGEKWFNMLSQEDPYEPGKLMGETFRFVCVYSRIERILDVKTPLALDEFGTLVEPPRSSALSRIFRSVSSCFGSCSNSSVQLETVVDVKPTQISLSLKNQRALSRYPLKGKENTPVFNVKSCEAVFDRCDACAPRNMVYFMRNYVAPGSRSKNYAAQMALMKAGGDKIEAPELEATPLEVRTLYSAVSILNNGSCPDNRALRAFSRASNTVRINEITYQTLSGNFVHGKGLLVFAIPFAFRVMGVAPSILAEASGH